MGDSTFFGYISGLSAAKESGGVAGPWLHSTHLPGKNVGASAGRVALGIS